MSAKRLGERHHRDCPEMAAMTDAWKCLWRQKVPRVGTLFCYVTPRCVVHVMDYDMDGWDVYVPVTDSNNISTTIAELVTRTSTSDEKVSAEEVAALCRAYDPRHDS